MKISQKTYLTSLVLLLAFFLSSNAQKASHNKEILLLNSYHKGFKWTDDITNSVISFYSDSTKYRVFVEYMDSKRFQSPEYFEQLVKLYKFKYAKTRIDGIICSDNNALDFCIKNRDSIWGNKTTAFCGINNVEDYRYNIDTTQYFGVEEKLNIGTNLKIAKQLFPNLEEIIVIGDKTLLFSIFYKQFCSELEKVDKKLKHQLIIANNTKQLDDTLRKINPKNKAIYLLSLYINKNGIPSEMSGEAREILKTLKIPVFGDWDFLMPDLIVGGNIISGTDQGTGASKLLSLKLKGLAPRKFAFSTLYKLSFDYNQLEKFEINKSQLPPNSLILYEDLPIWESYKSELLFIFSVIVALLLIIAVLMRNIIERKKAEIELIISEKRLELALEGANQGLWDVNLKDYAIYINKEFSSLLGYSSPKELRLLITNWESIIFKDDLLAIKETYYLHKSQKADSINTELRMVKKNGNLIWISIYGRITEWENDLPIRLTGTILDISNQKAFEDQLKFAKRKAEESDRLKSAFLANMSHEIRTPMNAIIGFSDLINDGIVSDNDRKTYLNQLKQSSESLLAIITDIIDLSKIEAGVINIKRERFDLNEILSNIVIIGKTLIVKQGKDIAIQVSNRSHLPLYIISDSQRLSQILINLITNAIKFTNQGSITIDFKFENNMVLFSVTDTGIGIDPEHISVIFDRFRQGDETMAKQFGGTGLGLTICKNLVNLLGGQITVKSQLNVGSTFSFSITNC